MRRLKSWGSSKASSSAAAADAAATEHTAQQWPAANMRHADNTPVHRDSQPQASGYQAQAHSGMTDEELAAMEQSALEYAIKQSQQQANRSPDPQAATSQVPAPQLPLPRQQHFVQEPIQQSGLQQQPYTPFQANAQPLPDTKKKGMAKLKQRFSLKKQPSQNLVFQHSEPSNAPNPYPMAAGGHHPGNPRAAPTGRAQAMASHDEATAVAAAMAASELAAQDSGRLSEHRSLEQEQEEEALMERAIKESEVQAEYDNVLRDAKDLRLDLQHALTKLLEQRVSAQQEHAELSELMGEFGLENAKGKGIAADDSIEQQFVQSEYNLEQANTRVQAVNNASSELQNLESFIRSTKPPRNEAITLTEEIVRQLLEKLNFLQLSFAAPVKKKKHQPAPAASAAIVDQFRRQQQQLPGPPTPPRPSQTPPRPPSPPAAEPTASTSAEAGTSYLDDLYADEEEEAGPSGMPPTDQAGSSTSATDEKIQPVLRDEEDNQQAEALLPEVATSGPSTSHVTTGSTTPSHVTDGSLSESPAIPSGHVTEAHDQAPAPSPAYLPTSPTSVTSPRALSHMDSHRSNESTGSNSMAVAQSKEQSRQLLEKASQKLASLLVNANDKNFDATRRPGDPAVRRAPQVVHLYQELRKLMGEEFMVKELNGQQPQECILQGMPPYQAPAPAQEQVRQRALSADPAAVQAAQADADRHTRMLSKLGGLIKTTKFRSMPEVVSFVQEAQEQLAVLKADEALVVSWFDAWPKQRLDVLREAAGQYQELNYIAMKYKKWMLQQGTCLQEAERIEEFFDTARARIEWLASRQEAAERRFAGQQVPWDRAAFKATRHASLHLAVIYMSRILFEVANLERSTTLKNEECLLFLADATRLGYKAHQFAGGFNVDSAELFGKVKRLTQYYTRSMDPTWLKDTTKFSNSNRQRWGLAARR